MTFPNGGPGYPQQGGGQQPPHQQPPSGPFPQPQQPMGAPPAQGGNPALLENLPMLLSLVVAVLGLVQYFLGFSDEARGVEEPTLFLLAAGALAGLHLLPRGPKTLPFAALFSLLGAFDALDSMIGGEVTPGIVIVVVVLGFLQLIVAVGALLLAHDVIKPPPPRPAAPQMPYGQPQQFGPGQQGPYTGPPQFGQQQGQPMPQPGQPPQQPGPVAATGEPSAPYTPPTTTPPGTQATTYAPMQGQFFQQPPGDTGQHNTPGTPPGGIGQG